VQEQNESATNIRIDADSRRTMNPVRNLWRTYRRYGVRGASALSRYYAAKTRAYAMGPGRECPICGWTGREFHPAVYPAHGLWRTRATCPRCGSFERHRALWFGYEEFLSSRVARPRTLHCAPERCFRPLFESRSARYITSNYDHEQSDVRLDLVNLGLRDETFDLIVANGVLSSVPDLRRAVDSLYRVLSPGGSALICDLVNLQGPSRECSPSPMGDRRSFGGRDLSRTFQPFEAELHDIGDFPPAADHARFGIRRDDFYLIRLRKPL
jgi:hypothetical protein